jgi:DNA-binding HxlR family transcriptional regulator
MKLSQALRRIRREIEILAYACEYDEQADMRRRVERLEQLMVERREYSLTPLGREAADKVRALAD